MIRSPGELSIVDAQQLEISKNRFLELVTLLCRVRVIESHEHLAMIKTGKVLKRQGVEFETAV